MSKKSVVAKGVASAINEAWASAQIRADALNKGNPFAPGQRVRLKSGSPQLTVEKISGDACVVTWHDTDKFHRTTFLAVTLTRDD